MIARSVGVGVIDGAEANDEEWVGEVGQKLAHGFPGRGDLDGCAEWQDGDTAFGRGEPAGRERLPSPEPVAGFVASSVEEDEARGAIVSEADGRTATVKSRARIGDVAAREPAHV